MSMQRTLESIPSWWETARVALYDEMGDPTTDKERLISISPLFHADQITKPLMVVQGANDPRVLQVESDEIVAALRNNSVPVEYLVFDDEGHGFQMKSNRIEASEAYLAFLSKYLPGPNTTKPTDDDETDTSSTTTTTSGSGGVASLASLCIWCVLLPMITAVQVLSL
jgi:acetyl esterase/lipase